MKQKLLQFDSNISYNIADFIISDSNKSVYNIIVKGYGYWGTKPYPTILLLLGPKSSGKTYLARIWQQIHNAYYINFTDHFNIADFTNALDKYEYFIIDDYQIKDEENIFHCFNMIAASDKILLITASNEYNFRLRDLKSRIRSLNHTKILAPDDNLLYKFIFKLFSDYSVIVNDTIIKYLINIIPRDFYSVNKIICHINDIALHKKKKVTIPFIKSLEIDNINLTR